MQVLCESQIFWSEFKSCVSSLLAHTTKPKYKLIHKVSSKSKAFQIKSQRSPDGYFYLGDLTSFERTLMQVRSPFGPCLIMSPRLLVARRSVCPSRHLCRTKKLKRHHPTTSGGKKNPPGPPPSFRRHYCFIKKKKHPTLFSSLSLGQKTANFVFHSLSYDVF